MSSPTIPADLVERMVKHLRDIEEQHRSSQPAKGSHFEVQLTEVRAIVALLPAPVDPDIAEAKRILHAAPPSFINSDLILAGIKLGRALAAAEVSK